MFNTRKILGWEVDIKDGVGIYMGTNGTRCKVHIVSADLDIASYFTRKEFNDIFRGKDDEFKPEDLFYWFRKIKNNKELNK